MLVRLLSLIKTVFRRPSVRRRSTRGARSCESLEQRQMLTFLPGFEQNLGQFGDDADFVFRSSQYTAVLDDAAATILTADGQTVTLTAVGGDMQAAAEGVAAYPAKANYYRGYDPDRWHVGVNSFGAVTYTGVWPGIDLVFHQSLTSTAPQLEYTSIAAPGADVSQIRFAVEGAESIAINPDGSLTIQLPTGSVHQAAPVSWQMDDDGNRTLVESRIRLIDDQQFGFAFGPFDADRALWVDPTLYGTTLAGGTGDDIAKAVAADTAGRPYVAGTTTSVNFPVTPGAPQQELAGATDIFVIHQDPFGAILAATYLGSSGFDSVNDIAIGRDGTIALVGKTQASDFPVLNASQSAYAGNTDGVFLRLDADLKLLHSTYFGGSGADELTGVAIADDGTSAVAGWTTSADLALIGSLQTYQGGTDGLVARFAADGTRLATVLFGGTSSDTFRDVAIGPNGNIYAAGHSYSDNFPTTAAALSRVRAGSSDLVVTQLSPDLLTLVASTYAGGTDEETGNAIAIDSDGDVAIVGRIGSVGSARNGEVGVTKLNGDLQTVVFTSSFGGTARDDGYGVAIDADNRIHVTGTAQGGSLFFPHLNWTETTSNLSHGAVYGVYEADGTRIKSGLLAGSSFDTGNAIAVDFAGHAFLVGGAASADFVMGLGTDNAKGGIDSFVARFVPDTRTMTYSALLDRAFRLRGEHFDRFVAQPIAVIDYPAVTDSDEAALRYAGLIPQRDLFVDAGVRFHDTKNHMDVYADVDSDPATPYEYIRWDETGVSYADTPAAGVDIPFAGRVVTRISAGKIEGTPGAETFARTFTIVANMYARFQGRDPMKEGTSLRIGGLQDVFQEGEPFAFAREVYVTLADPDSMVLLILAENIDHTSAIRMIFRPETDSALATLEVETTEFLRREFSAEEAGRKAAEGKSSQHVRGPEDVGAIPETLEAHDADRIVLGLDDNEDGVADRVVVTRIVNPQTGLVERRFEDWYGGQPVFYAVEQANLNPADYVEAIVNGQPTVRYADRASVLTEILQSDRPLQLHVFEEGQSLAGTDLVEANDNIVTGLFYTSSLAESATAADGYHSHFLHTAYRATDGNADGLSDFLAAKFTSAPVERITDLTVELSVVTLREDAGAGSVIGTVRRNNRSTAAVPVVVRLTSNDPAVQVPEFVTIPANEDAVSFSGDIVDDTVINGTRRITIAASADYLSPGSAALNVVDHEVPVITSPTASVLAENRPLITWLPIEDVAQWHVLVRDVTTSAVAVVNASGITDTQFQVSGSLPVGTYQVQVLGESAAGALTNWSAAVTFRVATAPTLVQPAGRISGTGVTIAWDALPGAVEYQVWTSGLTPVQPGMVIQQVPAQNGNVGSQMFVIDGELPLGKYRTWIRGFDAAGQPTFWSNAPVAVVQTAPQVMTAEVTVDATIRWTAVPGATHYDLRIDNVTTGQSQFFRTTVTEAEYTLSAENIAQSTGITTPRVRVWVRAMRPADSVFGFWSNLRNVFIGGPPVNFRHIAATRSLQWTNTDGASRYQLWLVSQSAPGAPVVIDVPSSADSYSVNHLSTGAYTAWIRAIGDVTGRWSAPVSFFSLNGGAAAAGTAGGFAGFGFGEGVRGALTDRLFEEDLDLLIL